MKHILFFSFILLTSKFCTAQNTLDSNNNKNALYQKHLIVNLGAGFPIVQGLESITTIGDTKLLQFIPAICLNIDKRYKTHYSIGLGIAWANVFEEPTHNPIAPESWTIVNVAFRLSYYYTIKNNLDGYFGARAGISLITEVVHFERGNVTDNSPTGLNFQIYSGFRLYLSEKIGIHVEAGIGNPFLVEIGLTLRLKTRSIN